MTSFPYPAFGALQVTDPRSAAVPAYAKRGERMLNDPRDVAFFGVMVESAAVACAGLTLFVLDVPLLYVAPVYWAVIGAWVLDRFTLMLHCTSHRKLFRKEYSSLNELIPSVLGPFFGQTPGTYFAHHMGMHHPEENLAGDLSSTMRYRRDRFDHWLRYWGRFVLLGLIELTRYLANKGQHKLMRRVLFGEGMYWLAMGLLFYVHPAATFVVFIVPLILMRTLMMMGNWAQHSFICAKRPDDPYLASITCINTRYNRRCFNDGYHVLHHVSPRCHWTEHPVEFERAISEYGRRDAIVFEGLDFFQVWGCLMLRRWRTLAKRFIQLPGAPTRDLDQVIALLRQRVMPVHR